MREDVAVPILVLPIDQRFGVHGVFAAAVMFQPDAAQPVGDAQQPVVMVEMMAAKGQQGFFHQGLVGGRGFGGEIQVFRLVRHDVQRDVMAQIDPLEMRAGEHWRIDQGFVIGLAPRYFGAALRRTVQRRGIAPAFGETHTGLHLDLAHIMPGGVQAHMRPFEIEHFARHGDFALVTRQRRGVGEARLDSPRPRRQINVERKALQRIAPPLHSLPINEEPHIRHLIHRPAGAVVAGDPLRQLQDQFACAGGERDGLDHLPQPPRGIAGVHIQRDRPAGIGGVHRIGYVMHQRRGGGHGALRPVVSKDWRRGGGPQGDGEQAGLEQGLCHNSSMNRHFVTRKGAHAGGGFLTRQNRYRGAHD